MARIGDEQDQRRHVPRRPVARHQGRARRGRVRRGSDEADDLVDIGDGDREADLEMGGVARLGEQMLGAPADHLFAEIDEGFEKILQGQRFRTTAVEGDHVAGKLDCRAVKRQS